MGALGKTTAFFALVTVVSLGLCGVGLTVGNDAGQKISTGATLGLFGGGLGLVICAVWAIVAGIASAFRNKP